MSKQKNTKSGIFDFKKKSLAAKTSLGVAVVLIFSLLLLVASSVKTASSELIKTINSEFTGIATENGIMVQNILDSASGTARDLQSYLQNSFAEYEQMVATQQRDEDGVKIPFARARSQVYDINLIETNREVETYILNTAWNAVGNSVDIAGIGVFFESNAFDPAIKDYTVYVGNQDAVDKTAQSYGAYEDYGSQDYYTEAARTQSSVFTKPYQDQGMTMITAAFPVVYKGETKGVIVVDLNVDNFEQLHSTDSKYSTMFANVYSDDSTIIYDSENLNNIGEKFSSLIGESQYSKIQQKISGGQSFDIKVEKPDGTKMSCFFYPILAEGKVWWSSTALEVDDLNKAAVKLAWIMIGMSALATIVILSFVSYFVKKMLRPIDDVVEAANEIAKGNLEVHLNSNSEDEIGTLAKTFEGMSDDLKSIISDVNYVLGEMAKGNFQVRSKIHDKYVGEYNGILLAMRDIRDTLTDTLTQINESSEQVNSGAEQVSDGAQALSQGATEQAASVQELSATIGEISNHIQETTENVQAANTLTGEVGNGVHQSNQKMQEMISAMSEITEKSNEIGKIIKTIDDIAFQTNILALNAAVEAARAGSAGKGFAVVADEVRNLAQKSAEAAKSTTVLIEGTVGAVTNGTKIADETAKSLEAVMEKSNRVVENIQNIADASDEQMRSIKQITTGIDQISSVVQTNSATAEESAAASEELSGQAQILKELISKFKLNIR